MKLYRYLHLAAFTVAILLPRMVAGSYFRGLGFSSSGRSATETTKTNQYLDPTLTDTSSRLTQLEQLVNKLLASKDQQISDLQNQMAHLQWDIDCLRNELTKMQQTQTQQQESAVISPANTTTVQDEISNLQQQITANSNAIANLKDQVVNSTYSGTTAGNSVTQNEFGNLKNIVDNLRTQASNTTATVSTLQVSVDNLNTEIAGLNAKVADSGSVCPAGCDASFKNLQSQIDSDDAALANLTNKLAAAVVGGSGITGNQLGIIEEAVLTMYEGRLNTLEKNISQQATEISKNAAEIASLNGVVQSSGVTSFM